MCVVIGVEVSRPGRDGWWDRFLPLTTGSRFSAVLSVLSPRSGHPVVLSKEIGLP